jgi:uncharacterized protein (TIGR00251 family)
MSAVPPCCRIAIKVIPNAPRNQITGWLGPALKIKVHAPPLDGRANEALCAFLAGTFGLPIRAVTLLQGEKSRQKLIQICGLDLAGLKSRVSTIIAEK